MNNLIKYVKYLLISFFSGLTSVIPGVSGGTIFAIFKISEDLTNSIKELTSLKWQRMKKNIAVPLIIGFGSLVSAIIYANLFTVVIEDYNIFLRYFFIGLVVLSIPILMKETKAEKSKSKKNILFLLGFLIALVIFYISPDVDSANNDVNSLGFYIEYFIVNFINGVTMIIPGVSGTNIIIMFGQYDNYLLFMSDFSGYLIQNIIFLIAVVLGSVFSSYLLSYIFKKYYAQFFSLMAGLTMSTVVFVYINPFSNIIQAISGFIIGSGLIILVDKYSKKSN
ncbi:MAG: DUF368 domain-containing protein [Mycoplasmatales bacterium]